MKGRSVGYECEYRVWSSALSSRVQIHSSPYMYLLRQGGLTFTSGSQVTRITPASCIWWPTGKAAKVTVDSSLTSGYILRFRRSALAAHLIADDELLRFYSLCENYSRTQSPELPITPSTLKKLKHIVTRMADCWHGTAPFRNLTLKAHGLTIINHLVQDASFQTARQDFASLKHDQRIVDLLAWLDQNLDEPSTLDDLAERCGLARSRFTQLFREFTGRSPQDYLRRMRVASACRLLRNSDQSVTDICYAVGFGSAARFHAAFVDILGMSPGKWRQSHEHQA